MPIMNKSLFSEFEPVSAKAFKQKIQYDLSGADYNETLLWSSPEGIHVKPFYHQEDTQPVNIPGHPQNWSILEEVYILNAKSAALHASSLLDKGVEALSFKADAKFNIEDLLNHLPKKKLTLYFSFSFLDPDFIKSLSIQTLEMGYSSHFNVDIISNLAHSGNWYTDLKSDHKALENILLNTHNDNVIGVDMSLFHNSGANCIQELAYALAQTNEYYTYHSENLRSQTINYKVAIGSNYFFEIAKLRTLRLLHATLAEAYGLNENCHIIAQPATRNKVLYDYNTNMLRTTTECMSAILGGADAIFNLAYDSIYHKSNEFGQRIARNQLLLLKHESYFDLVSNPADGTYYIETLTKQFAEKALDLFKEIEAGDGFISQLIAGKIQKKVKATALKEQEAFNEGKKVLVGTNTYINSEDRMKEDLELYPFLKMNPRKTLIEPIIEKRLAEEVEQKRLQDE